MDIKSIQLGSFLWGKTFERYFSYLKLIFFDYPITHFQLDPIRTLLLITYDFNNIESY